MHSFNFAWNSQCATVWSCSYCCPLWCAVCCGLISNMAAFSFSNWAQATAVRVINKDGKTISTLDSNNDEKHCKEVNNYNTIIIWFISCQGVLHNLRQYLLFLMLNFNSYCKFIPFMERKFPTIRMWRCVLWLIEFGRAWTWYGQLEGYFSSFLSSCFYSCSYNNFVQQKKSNDEIWFREVKHRQNCAYLKIMAY